MRITALPVLCAIVAGPSLVSTQNLPPDPFLQWMDRIAQQHLDKRASAIAAIHTVAEAERRKKRVRETLLDILGGFPGFHGPLRARITGQIQADGYTIEKVLFESLPGFFVTANVYRPAGPGRYPGVLLQSGHTQEGKPEPQRLAANLALKGFVALAFDPIGQGEREQTYDPQLQGPAAGWSVPESEQAMHVADREDARRMRHHGSNGVRRTVNGRGQRDLGLRRRRARGKEERHRSTEGPRGTI